MEIRIKYFSDRIEKLRYINGVSDWIDLRSAEDITMKAGEFRLIPLGVGMELPAGYEAHCVPRSSNGRGAPVWAVAPAWQRLRAHAPWSTPESGMWTCGRCVVTLPRPSRL